MKSIATLLVFALTLTAVAAGDRTAFRCRIPRAEAVKILVDLFTSHGWEILSTDRELGLVTARRFEDSRQTSIADVMQCAADGDSLRVVTYRVEHTEKGEVYRTASTDATQPLLWHFPNLATTPIKN